MMDILKGVAVGIAIALAAALTVFVLGSPILHFAGMWAHWWGVQ